MRTPELIELAKKMGLVFTTIEAIQEYRRTHA
jgi:3,4-dihydroxy-2-butanone 4-phosphate synthase